MLQALSDSQAVSHLPRVAIIGAALALATVAVLRTAIRGGARG